MSKGLRPTPLEPDPVETGGGSAEMSEFSTAFPNSQKTYVDGPQGVRVPMREVALSGGDPPLRVYDTSGPQDHDVEVGLPNLREEWVHARLKGSRSDRWRRPALADGGCATQLPCTC